MVGTLAAAFEAVEDAQLLLVGDADAVVLDDEIDFAALAPAVELHDAARPREADGIRHQIVEDLPHARLVGNERADAVLDAQVDRQVGRDGAFAQRQDRRIDEVPRVDLVEPQFECAGVNGRQVEDAVDRGKQLFGFLRDVIQVFALARTELAHRGARQQFGRRAR